MAVDSATTTGVSEAHGLVAPPAARRFRFLTDRRLAVAFILPAFGLLLLLSVYPLFYALYLSFTDYSATRNTGTHWIWFHNYGLVLHAPSVHVRAIQTGIFVAGAIALETVLGFAIAFLISRRARGGGILTTLLLLPMMLSPVVVGLFWRFMLDAQFGVINSIIGSLGGPKNITWLTNSRQAMLSLILVDAWQWTPFIMLIALAGLTAVPKYLYEAAEIDRASGWFKFRQITFPMVWPLVLIAILFRAIDAFRLFDLVYILTGGGPGNSTETLSFQIYRVAFQNFDTGLASAYGLLMVLVVIVLSQIYIRYLSRVQEH
jgi:multiple sugar transport system permease protein